MKTSTLQAWLFSQIEILEYSGARASASGLRRISEILRIRDDANIKDICKALNKLRHCGDGETKVKPIAELLSLIVESACKFAKAADAKDLRLFAAAIERRKDECIDTFVSRASSALIPQATPPALTLLTESDVRTYLHRLEEALGDEEGFESVYRQLSNDTRLKTPEAKKLAKDFAGKSGRGKADALALIYGRHKSLISARPKAYATADRLAG